MARPDPIQYAERLYGAIRAANFSPISFLAFGNAIKDGVPLRNMPRIAAEPFMRIVGEMVDLEEQANDVEILEATLSDGPVREAKSKVSTTAASEGSVIESELSPTVDGSDTRAATVPEKRGTEG
jgi:hypothetical protein